jgi:hypothetical protein
MKIKKFIIAISLIFVASSAPLTSFAGGRHHGYEDENNNGWHDRGEIRGWHNNNGWHNRGDRPRHHWKNRYYAPAPIYYYPPQPVYYYQPRPVYHQPRPVYYYPQRQSSYISFGFNLDD